MSFSNFTNSPIIKIHAAQQRMDTILLMAVFATSILRHVFLEFNSKWGYCEELTTNPNIDFNRALSEICVVLSATKWFLTGTKKVLRIL